MANQQDFALPAIRTAEHIDASAERRDTLIWVMLWLATSFGIIWGGTIAQAASRLLTP